MSRELFKKLEQFKNKEKLSVVALCRKLDTHTINYYRWKKAQKITGAYKKIIADFLAKSEAPLSAVKNLSSGPCDIAVIGMACYYPGASNVKELWENIMARRVQFRRMLDQRLPLGEYYDEDAKAPEKTYLTKAAFLENFVFDWGRLRIPKKTVESTDIVHWLALDTALKTFEDAGYKLNEIPLQNTSVIVGNTLTGEQTRSQSLRLRWPYVQKVLNATLGARGMSLEERRSIAAEMEQIYKSAFYPITEDSLAGGLANTIAGRICNYLNFKGGGYIVDGACSSSLLAVATAADALKMGNMDLVLAGGVDISLDPFELVGFAKAGALARDKMSVYDQSANGFLPGEGCGFVLLKRLNDALRDKNYIYAVIKGWGISSDGKGGIMEPSSSGQSFAIGRAYKNLGYTIADVDFVEGHGTGTTKGDRVELEGIATAIDQTVKKGNENKRSCGVTSFKSIVGHTKAAAGIGGLLKAIMAVNQRILPPTASCVNPNEVFKDKAKNLYPLIQGRILPSTTIARAGISSAGFGGINCHMTVESHDPPKDALQSKIDQRALLVSQQQSEVFVFTSRTILHLRKIIEKFKQDLRNISIAEMADLAALLNKKVKNRLPIKVAIVTDSPEHLYDALILLEQDINEASIDAGQMHRIPAKDPNTQIILSHGFKKCRIGFLYPGQGSQRLNMTRVLVERFAWARDLLGLSKLPLFEHIYKTVDQLFIKEEVQEFEKQLSDTQITQPAIIASSLIWTEFLSRLNIEPQCVAGHSLGELTAFYKAGAFDPETVIKFAQLRGALMAAQGNSAGSMVSLFCSKSQAQALVAKIEGNIILANINSPSQMIVSGGNNEIEKIIELAQKENISTHRLNVSNAFHSALMKPASQEIRSSSILPDIFKPRNIKVYSGMSDVSIDGTVKVKDYFSKQVISPVDFVGLVETMSKECDVLIEVGPGRVLTDLVKAIRKDQGPLCLPVESSAQNDRDLNIVLAELFVRNVDVKWEELYKNRLIRVFVPASRKKFIENQCEHPLKIGNQILKGEFLQIPAQVEEVVAQKEEVIPGGLPVIEGKDNIADLLIDLTQQITGFEKESITLNSRLLDDLNLDSIKAAELIGQAAKSLGIAGQLDPSKLSNNTLGEIRNRLFELSQSRLGASAQGEGESVFKRYHDKTWVRNFVLDLKSEEIVTKNVNQFKDIHQVVLLSEESELLTDQIAKAFKSTKVQTEKVYYDDKIGKTGQVDCLIAILPRTGQSGDFDKEAFKEIIRKEHKIVDLAYSNQMSKDAFVVVVQFGGGNFGENKDLKDIQASCAKSIISTLYLERPDLKVRAIDFDIRTPDKEIASRVMDELQTYERFNAVGYDAKLARKVVYYKNSEPIDYKTRDIVWSAKDVVLVTGGAKGITAQCALEFARSTKARMVLVGRSPSVDPKDENNEIVQTLKQFEKEHLKASYYQCDVTDEKSVAHVIKEIQKAQGRITGFIHGAGLNSLRRLKQETINEAWEESLPKVMGAVNVCQALGDAPLKLIVAITSIIGLTGMEGSGWYGLSNEVLNLYLHQFKARHPKTQIAALAYSIWDEIGMGSKLGSVDKLAEKGIGAIPVAEGIKRFRQLIEGDPGAQQVIVAARLAGLDTWKTPVLKTDHLRFIEDVKYLLPGVELIAQAHLNVKEDPYLLDHSWKGSLLFPFVFGFEAMAQAVACVLGVETFEYIQAKDINLQRPIPVPEDSEAIIEIHAQVLERASKGGTVDVKVEIYSQESAYQEPHFSAVFEVGPKVVEAKQSLHNKVNNLDIVPETDLYGPVLFQGKSFQCIKHIHELFYNEKTRKGECLLSSAYKAFDHQFLIGNPFFVDSVLQSMQLIIPQDLSLPRKIEAITLYPKDLKSKESCLIKSYIHKISNEQGIGNARAYDGDHKIVEIKDCDLKILQTITERPSANDLVDPTVRDQKIVEDKLRELSREIGFEAPVIRCLYDNRLVGAKKALRHKIEIPLIKEAVTQLLKRDKKPVGDFKINWQKNGKPVVTGRGVKDVGVSVSHDGAFLLVVAGNGAQGCDVESIVKRTDREWLALLGKEKHKIMGILVNKGVDVDLAGTSVWTSSEVVYKLNKKLDTFDLIQSSDDKYYVFRNKDLFAINIVIQCTKKKIILSLFSQYEIKDSRDSLVNKLGYRDDYFNFSVEYTGPQKQLVTVKRFPVTFKANKLKNKGVNFSTLFDWIGEIREFSILPIYNELTDVLATGEWGISTNNVYLDIKGDIKIEDILEVRFWLDNRVTLSVFDLCYDFIANKPNGSRERVAFATQRISWIKVLRHGIAKVDKAPAFFNDLMDKMLPNTSEKKENSVLKEGYKNFKFGEILLNAAVEYKDRYLSELEFDTSTEESNLVGNIYFSNYAKWMNIITDRFFYKNFSDMRTSGEVFNDRICIGCDIIFLNEAMPFDTITIQMHLSELYDNGFKFKYIFYKDEKKTKLAVGELKFIWVKRTMKEFPSQDVLPEQIIEMFRKLIVS